MSLTVGVPSEGTSICTSHLGLVSQRTENQPMQFPQTACDAAQGDDSAWSHELTVLTQSLMKGWQVHCIGLDKRTPPRGTCTGLRGGPVQTSQSSARPSAKCCQGNPQYHTDRVMGELRRTWGYKTKFRRGLAMCAHITEGQAHPGLHKKQHGQ